MYVRMPDLCNMVQPIDYSFKEISILIKKNLALLASEHWVVRLHRSTSDSVTGGKLRHYRTIKADPNPSPYLLAPLGPGQRWVVGSLRAGCLPLAVSTDLRRCPWWTGFAHCVTQDVWKMKFTLELHVELYTTRDITRNLARVDSDFLLLNNYEKFLHYVCKLKCVHYCQRCI